MENNKPILSGTQITSINTLGTMYDNQTIRVTIDKDNKISFARIRVADLLPILSEFDYMIDEPKKEDKRRTNTYLQPIIDQTGVKEYEEH